jgi:hypothetical protein
VGGKGGSGVGRAGEGGHLVYFLVTLVALDARTRLQVACECECECESECECECECETGRTWPTGS